MFDVLLESCAESPRRSGGAVVSLVAHVAIVGAVALGAAREVVCKRDLVISRMDGRSWGCPVIPVESTVVVWVKEPAPGPTTDRTGHVGRAESSSPPVKSPRPVHIDFSTRTFDGPGVKVDITNGGAVERTEFCSRAEDCDIVPRPDGHGRSADPAGITSGSELAARLVGAPARPRYPESLRAVGLGGRVLVQFTVDTTGRVDPQAVRVLESTHELFSRAVLEVLPRYRFVPAEVDGRRVRMVAQMPFEFTITK